MFRNVILLILLIFVSESLLSQRKNSYGQNIRMYKTDRVLLAINYLHWQELPAQIDLENINRGFYLGYFIDNPIGGSRISLAFGLSLSTVNLYSDAIPTSIIDSSCTGADFIKIKDICQLSDDYKSNKMAFTYAGIPVELRLRFGKSESFKIAFGFEAGILATSYVKYKGPDFYLKNNDEIKIKYFNIKHSTSFRYGPSFRIGYNRFTFRAFYPLTKTFEEGSGKNAFPIEIGLSLMVF